MPARIWERLANTGIGPETSAHDVRNIRIINQISAMALGGCFFFGLYFLPSETVWGSALCFFIALIVVVPLVLVHFRRLRLATIFFIYQYYFIAFLIAFAYGRAAAAQSLVILVPAFSVIVFKKTRLWLQLSIGFVAAAACQAILFFHEPLIRAPNPLVYEALMMTLMALIFFMLIFFYKTETQRLEAAVFEKNARFEAANDLLKAEVAERLRTEEKLQAANLGLQQFASLASHDMKEPLRTISSFAQLLNRRLPPEKTTSEFLHFITDAAQRMARLLDDLIAFARAGSVHQEAEAVDLNEVAGQVGNNLYLLIEQKNATLEIAADLPVLMGHSTLFTQLLQNLVANGLKFQQKDRPPLVEVFAEKTGDGSFRITVRDNGIGIGPQFHGQIFEPFRRLHARTEFDGSGIGLATCHKIVQFYGGRISLESPAVLGQSGTAFHVFLPEKLMVAVAVD